jgi:TPR repeat protein
MGIIYGRGNGVPKDLAKSFQWFSLAATNGSSDAMTLLAYDYYWAKGTQRDITNAFLWYKKATNLGNVQAQTALALYCYMGSNKEGEPKQAIELLHSAANHWYPQAQYFLAIYVGKGVGVKKDTIEAYKWASIASDNGYKYATGLRDVIKDEEKLDSNQIAEALRRAKEFTRTNPAQPENIRMPDIVDMNGLYDFIRNTNNSVIKK